MMTPSSSSPLEAPRHDPGPLEDWRRSLANVENRRKVILDRRPLPNDGVDLLECDCEFAALASLFEDRANEMPAAVARAAAAGAAAAFAQGEVAGTVILKEPGRPRREIPVGPAMLTPTAWRDAFMAACVARDQAALSILCLPRRIAASQLPLDRADSFWEPYCRALGSLVVEPAEFSGHAEEAFAKMEQAQIISPTLLALVDRPLLELARVLCTGSADHWNATVARTIELHRTYYGQESHRFDRLGFLALGVIGLCARAHDQGVNTGVISPYLPRSLISPNPAPALSRVAFIYARYAIIRPEEAGWFLDLAGYPPKTRSHRILEQDGHLLARYEVSSQVGPPEATVDFVLRDPSGGTVEPHLELALDAGQLLWLAEQFSTKAGDTTLDLRERRALLGEAIDCVESALTRIAPDAASVSASSIVSPLGKKLYAAEPGRFQRDRLSAYQGVLIRHQQKLSEATHTLPPSPGETIDEPDARTTARASIELIKAQVSPILHGMARDRSGEVIRMLKPRDGDYEKVFVGDAIRVAREYYATVWKETMDLAYPSPSQTELRCFIAPAGMLADENELSRQFPGGYRAIARWLNPHRVWVAWKFVAPGQPSGMAYNGLVWCDDHWAWFPKPYRALAPLSATN
jgi:hypothetical protein